MKDYSRCMREERLCLECSRFLDQKVRSYSMEHFGVPLCFEHQARIRNSKATSHAIGLYFALRVRGVPAELEKWDGYKSIDIAVVEAKVNIEVDGAQHNFDPEQALSDLKRTYHSFRKGYLTLRIPNSLIEWNLDQTADFITEFLNEAF